MDVLVVLDVVVELLVVDEVEETEIGLADENGPPEEPGAETFVES